MRLARWRAASAKPLAKPRRSRTHAQSFRRHPRAADATCRASTTAALAAAREREAQLTKPAGSLGRLEEIAEFMAAWQGGKPHVDAPLVAVFAGNHGVVAQGVSPFPALGHRGDGRQFPGRRRGDQPDLQDLRHFAESLRTRAVAADRRHHRRSRRSTSAPARRRWPSAWRRSPAARICWCSAKWASAIRPIAAAIYCALFGGEPEDWVGRGTGVDDAGLKRKADAVRAALKTHEGHLDDPARSAAPARRPRDRGDGRRHSGRAASAHARAARRLRRLLGGGGAARARSGARSIIAWPATSRPRTPTRGRCGSSTRRRC